MRSISILSCLLLTVGCATVEVPEAAPAEVAAATAAPTDEARVEQVAANEWFGLTNETGIEELFFYDGKNGDVIEIQYREFSRDLEKPEFIQKITQDLSQSLEFEVQGFKFEVVEATGLYLRFRLLKE